MKEMVKHSHLQTQNINELMQHNRLQMENMKNMMRMMSGMQEDIANLKNRCDDNGTSNLRTKIDLDSVGEQLNVMKSTMNSRFDVVEDKQKFNEILYKNQQWEYSAPRPSQEYWGTADIFEVEAAKDFLKQMKSKTREMRHGNHSKDKISVNVRAILRYNEEFLPHWEEFSNALVQYKYCLKCLPKDTDSMLSLFGMELPDTVLELLSKALESSHFTSFILGDNNFGQRGIGFALNYLKSNSILKHFALVSNPIESIKDIKQICQTVEDHPSIEAVALGRCKGADMDGYEMLQMIMTSGKNKLKGVDLSHNNISTGGGTFISDFLTDSPMLQILKLEGNQLDDNDAIVIAKALKHNTNLHTLDLTVNNISKSGWVALHKAEFDDTSLNSVADSNHTCNIRYPSEGDEIQGLDTSEMNGGDIGSEFTLTPAYVRDKKIYSVLSSQNRECSNVGHFDDIPVELLPNMLSTIQQYSEYHIHDQAPHRMRQSPHDVNSLSVVYEICRFWDKSLAVFESLSS